MKLGRFIAILILISILILANNINFNRLTGFNIGVLEDAITISNITKMHSYPASIAGGGYANIYCGPKSSRYDPENIDVTLYYKNNQSNTWNELSTLYVDKQIISTHGDSITAGSQLHHPDPAYIGLSEPNVIEHQYQYWLDYHMSSNASALNSSGYEVYNRAYPGYYCSWISSRFERDSPGSDYAIIMCGTNAIYNWTEESSPYVPLMIDSARSRSIKPILMTIPPMSGNAEDRNCQNITDYNNWLRDYSRDENIILVDLHPLFTDGIPCDDSNLDGLNTSLFNNDAPWLTLGGWVHPNIRGHKVIANAIWEQAFNKTIFGGYKASVKIDTPGQYDIKCTVTEYGGLNESKIYTNNIEVTGAMGEHCGDETCNNGESCYSCSGDCGECQIADTTPPTFTTISNITIDSESSLISNIQANDNIEIDKFSINDTTNFAIVPSNGTLTNATKLNMAIYNINISVNDTSGNIASELIWINVSENVQEHCGDGLCNNNETCSSCSSDCGECTDTDENNNEDNSNPTQNSSNSTSSNNLPVNNTFEDNLRKMAIITTIILIALISIIVSFFLIRKILNFGKTDSDVEDIITEDIESSE